MNKLTVLAKGKVHLLLTGQQLVLDKLLTRIATMIDKKVKVGSLEFRRVDSSTVNITVMTSEYTLTYLGASSDELEKLINKL